MLQPLPYHLALRDYLKAEEAEVWRWFAGQRVRAEQAEAERFELLKSTYRMDRESQPAVYAAAEAAAGRLGLHVPITLYQAQNPAGLNASLAFVPDEAHIVLHGPVAARLSEPELRALLAHELSHLVLWRCGDGEHLIVGPDPGRLDQRSAGRPAAFRHPAAAAAVQRDLLRPRGAGRRGRSAGRDRDAAEGPYPAGRRQPGQLPAAGREVCQHGTVRAAETDAPRGLHPGPGRPDVRGRHARRGRQDPAT